MNLLFDIDDDGSDLIKTLLGFSDADLKIEDLQSDLISASDDLIALVGQSIYDSAYGIFTAESSSASDAELLRRMQLPIALQAYRTYAPDNDLRHTNSGRVVSVEEHQKIPWEWQIDRSDKSLERKHYKATDALLNYLDSSVASWKNSDAYKETHELFVRTTKDFNDYFDIAGSRILLIKLAPGLRRAETSEIKARIGKDKFTEMKEKLKANQPIDEDLLAKIKEACVYKALAWGMRRLSVQFYPEGVLQYVGSDRMSTQGKLPPVNSEAEGVAQYFERDADAALRELEEMITEANNVPDITVPIHTPYFNCDDNFIST